MKPQLLKISQSPVQSFSVRHDLKPSMDSRFHYHPEVELIHFIKGKGSQFIGDSITEFKAGDLILLGSNLPHYWRFEKNSSNIDNGQYGEVQVAHFSESFIGEHFLNLPENKAIKELLEKSKRGIKVNGKSKDKVAAQLDQLQEAQGPDRIIYLMLALVEIIKSDDLEILSSVGFTQANEENQEDRIKAVYDYTFANFHKKINLDEIAEIASISPNSFCRYFKTFTKKTYSRFLAEVKVGQACKLLIDNRLSIKQVFYESGFNNFSSFYKCFKDITGKSPLTYQKEFITT